MPFHDELKRTADALAAPGKGILASDEPIPYMDGRFEKIGLPNTPETRRKYRQLLYSTPSMSKYISGVILSPETVCQQSDNGVPFPKLLRDAGVLPGVTVDGGLIEIGGGDGEAATEGLDGLEKRCKDYKKVGCAFAKWRAVYRVGANQPSSFAIEENGRLLARYASICQENGLVPIVEPDISREGACTIEEFQQATERVLSYVYYTLHQHGVYLEGTILKPNMVAPGFSCPEKASLDTIGLKTVQALSRTVPAAVPGIGFLSGGQSAEEATKNLKAISQHRNGHKWSLSFIFGRALQENVMESWAGKDANVHKAQEQLIKYAKANSEASQSHL